MKKSSLALIACLLVTLTLAVGGTIAYLTDTDSMVNTFTIGEVDIQLNEKYTQNSTLMPGDSVEKEATITNIGKNDAYVFMSVAVPAVKVKNDNYPIVDYKFDEEGWTKKLNNQLTEIEGEDYMLSVYAYNKILFTRDEGDLTKHVTLPGLKSITLNPQVDYDPNSKGFALVTGGVATPIDVNLTTGKVYVNAYAIQTKGFEDTTSEDGTVTETAFDKAYNAYVTQWGNWSQDQIVIPTTGSTVWFDKDETPDDNTFTLSTAEDLFGFASLVNGGNDFAGKTIKLGADIDLNSALWTPIGQTGATEFKGVFDGDGHTIKNLYVNNTDESANCSTGLFGWIESHGTEGVTVKNLTIDGANITGHHYVGAIVGYVYGTIENCHVKNATISCTAANDDANGDKAGAIVGYVGEDAKINSCTAANSSVSAGRDAGQIVGAAKPACVTDCTATNVTVTANGTSTGNNISNEVIGRKL